MNEFKIDSYAAIMFSDSQLRALRKKKGKSLLTKLRIGPHCGEAHSPATAGWDFGWGLFTKHTWIFQVPAWHVADSMLHILF